MPDRNALGSAGVAGDDEYEARRTAWTDAEVAVVYDRARPGYPAAAVAFAVAGLGDPVSAVDVGAGTGKLTAALCAAGVATVAVEPAPGMLTLLRRTVQRGRVLAGTAEALPVPAPTSTALTGSARPATANATAAAG